MTDLPRYANLRTGGMVYGKSRPGLIRSLIGAIAFIAASYAIIYAVMAL